ncbi:MAG TPA: hypothetical protein VJX29_13125 [Candidatus Acidoferrales bacterium]|nr:hypothetical protein [Candidatus Acidoferrales bacterium]
MFLRLMGGAGRSALSPLWSTAVKLTALATLLFTAAQPLYALPGLKTLAIPAFARKYGLPCSACHTAWPELNNFGQVFRDNGYQLMNERDSPIWQNPSYFPITLRMTPNWHLENTTNQPVDSIPGGTGTSTLVSKSVQVNGFDLSGMDFWTAGTLYKNVSFSLLPSSDNTASFHFENAFVRFDNLAHSTWFNLKFGKFELDNLVSEKRFLFLSNNGGLYQNYHFAPLGDSNGVGLGDNQLGMELTGHSANSYTRYGVALLSDNDGTVGLPSNRGYSVYLTFSQAFQAGSQGLQRIGAYAYIGQQPTYYMTSSGVPIPGEGIGNKPFYRAGFSGDFFLFNSKLEFLPFFLHGYDNVYLGIGAPSNVPLATLCPTTTVICRAPTWNGGFIETHVYYSPQLVFIGRYEVIRMDQQALSTNPSDQSNIDAYSIGYRWYPIMFSRAGLAFHNEYSIVKGIGIVPLSGDGVGLPPLAANGKVWSGSLFIGFDFDF